jgi:hypothetical protein
MLGALALIGGLASTVYGGIKSAQAANEQKKLIKQQAAKNDAWYNKNYYENYMDSREAQAAMKRVEDTMRRRTEQARANAAVSGETPESVAAGEQRNQEMMADTVSRLAERSDARKREVDAQRNANDNRTQQLTMQQKQMDEAGGAALMNSGLGLVGSSLSSMDGGAKGDADAGDGGGSATSSGTEPATRSEVQTPQNEVKTETPAKTETPVKTEPAAPAKQGTPAAKQEIPSVKVDPSVYTASNDEKKRVSSGVSYLQNIIQHA